MAIEVETETMEKMSDQPRVSAWERVQLARHAARPHMLDYVKACLADFVELHGDRRYGDDKAIVGGLARLNGRPIVVIGHQKGRDTKENVERNFGMPHPEGYRKAWRLMKHAEKFGFPVITFIDTPGAHPDLQAEERGQSEAIAQNLLLMATLRVPIVSTVIGEGGSGGALALGVADRVLMLANSIYAVASPEGCAAILWKDSAQAPLAAEAMRITAPELLALGLIDEVVPEPEGGAHTDARAAAALLGEALERHLADLLERYVRAGSDGLARMIEDRYQKFRRIGYFAEDEA